MNSTSPLAPSHGAPRLSARPRSPAWPRPTLRILATICLFAFLTANAAALNLSIIERGTELDADVGLWVDNLRDTPIFASALISPSGEIFTPASILEQRPFKSLVRKFDSVAAALAYVEGPWKSTMTNKTPGLASPAPLDFSIGPVSLSDNSRIAPTLLAPSPGALIRNGSEFRLDWDYVTTGIAPNRTSIDIVPLFNTGTSLHRSIATTPNGSASSIPSFGSTGAGAREFTTTIRNVPGATENRFISTFEALPTALPLNVEITLGSYVSFIDTISPPQGPLRQVDFFYTRELAPFTITLSTVPEPHALVFALAAMIAATLIRPRRPLPTSGPRLLTPSS